MPKKTPVWFRQRNYLHFDLPIGYRSAKKLVTNPKKVAENSFYPFIHYVIKSQKIEKDSSTGIIETLPPKKRPISYAAHRDSSIYSYYAYQLTELYENELTKRHISNSVLAFRTLGKNNVDFAKFAFDEIQKRGNCSVVALDIKSFFDTLDHGILKQQWAKLLGKHKLPKDHFAVYKSLTRFSKVSRDKLYEKLGISIHNPKHNRYRICEPEVFRHEIRKSGLITTNTDKFGIPQGSPISALISNIYMMDFDENASRVVEEQGGVYLRYCDDMLFIVPNEFRDDIQRFAERSIKNLKIEINRKKTEKRKFVLKGGVQISSKPLQYLGFTFDGERVLIRSAALARYSDKMKRGVKFAGATMRKRNEIRKQQGLPPQNLYKRQLYKRYSHLGSRNFLSYGLKASKVFKSRAIRRQLKPLWGRLNKKINNEPIL